MVIDAQNLQQLVDAPSERLDVELKGWLDLSGNAHRGTLAKALITLANHDGGVAVIGFDTGGDPADNRPDNLVSYEQNAIDDVVDRVAGPTFHCSVKYVKREAKRTVAESPSTETTSASYRGGLPRTHGFPPRCSIQRPISAHLNSGQVIQISLAFPSQPSADDFDYVLFPLGEYDNRDSTRNFADSNEAVFVLAAVRGRPSTEPPSQATLWNFAMDTSLISASPSR